MLEAFLGGVATLLLYFGGYNFFRFYVLNEEVPRVEDVIATCPFCGARSIALDYHLKRCRKKPKSIPIKAQGFEPGQRRW